ncbi:hypothetical protein [Luteimonas sp. MC1750]|uniref:hypothetical protein n=1 Tax=Luteimonas sp. MC1750 TaxID=2799326 RepID=UPI0018F05E46|nr:hypothetical protein [Luteimonas sp. MC1750]MBJ6984010.1 hypothetical protein [Luteimonas sp. MC1750]QQO06822.1 hypothetical protein JGR68_05190 [Luteimonas sp. MC1750]
MRFDPLAFLAGVAANKSQAPEELFIPDNTPTEIANARLNQINRNANADFFEAQADQIDLARVEAKRTRTLAVQIAVDRLALHETLAFVEKRWREGATVEQTFKEAQKVRGDAYDKIMRDPNRTQRLENGVRAMTGDKAESRSSLVDDMPVGSKPKAIYRPSRPAPGHDR